MLPGFEMVEPLRHPQHEPPRSSGKIETAATGKQGNIGKGMA
jgi:hypothetical protein